MRHVSSAESHGRLESHGLPPDRQPCPGHRRDDALFTFDSIAERHCAEHQTTPIAIRTAPTIARDDFVTLRCSLTLSRRGRVRITALDSTIATGAASAQRAISPRTFAGDDVSPDSTAVVRHRTSAPCRSARVVASTAVSWPGKAWQVITAQEPRASARQRGYRRYNSSTSRRTKRPSAFLYRGDDDRKQILARLKLWVDRSSSPFQIMRTDDVRRHNLGHQQRTPWSSPPSISCHTRRRLLRRYF